MVTRQNSTALITTEDQLDVTADSDLSFLCILSIYADKGHFRISAFIVSIFSIVLYLAYDIHNETKSQGLI